MASYASNNPFYAAALHFLKWLPDRPGTTIKRKIEKASLRVHNAGRGIGEYNTRDLFVTMFAKARAVAVEDLEEDEEMFTISWSDAPTVQHSSLQRTKPHVLECLDSSNLLVLIMTYEDGLREISKWSNCLQMSATNFEVRGSRTHVALLGSNLS